MRVAVGVPGEDVAPPQACHDVAGERVATDHHPRVAPDGDGDVQHRRGHRPGPLRPGLGQPRRDLHLERLDEEPLEGVERTGDGLDVGHPDRCAARSQSLHVELAVLLLVGHDEVGRKGRDGLEVGILRAADPLHRKIARVGAPVRRSDEAGGRGGGEGLGDGGHERHDTAGHGSQPDGIPQVVSGHPPPPGRCSLRAPEHARIHRSRGSVRFTRCAGTGRRPRRRPPSPAGASTPAPPA